MDQSAKLKSSSNCKEVRQNPMQTEPEPKDESNRKNKYLLPQNDNKESSHDSVLAEDDINLKFSMRYDEDEKLHNEINDVDIRNSGGPFKSAINDKEVSEFHDVKRITEIHFMRYTKDRLLEGKHLIEARYESRVIAQIEKHRSLKQINLDQVKRDIQLHFLQRMEEAILLFNARQYEQCYKKLDKIAFNFDDFSEILLIYKGFDKNVLGEFLSKKKPPNKNSEILNSFMNHLNFKGEMVPALRFLMSLVNMPQDASLMLIIIDAFSQVYFEDNKENFKDVNTVYLLSCSVLSLNSLFHNTCHKDKMSVESFIKMNRDVDPEAVRKMFVDIQNNKLEIVYDCKYSH